MDKTCALWDKTRRRTAGWENFGQKICAKQILLAVVCVLIDREEVSRIQTELLLRRAQNGDTVPLFAGQLCLLRLVQGPEAELPRVLPLLAGVLAVCMGWQCAKLASRPEWAAEY